MKPIIYILWDASYVWGFMALHTLQGMQLPFKLVTSDDITHGLLFRKPPALLLVPGGTASIKASTLGTKGRAAIKEYVSGGGKYFGFCGGAGLGLTGKDGLGLCPWKRATYSSRLHHLVSGHIISKLISNSLVPQELGESASLPVWWPGFFEPQHDDEVQILATYTQPDSDFCLADINLSSLPEHIFNHWQDIYGINMGVDFLYDHPCVVSGFYGKGQYVLSYAHLETPDSAAANAFMVHIVHILTGIKAKNTLSPIWDIAKLPIKLEKLPETAALHEALHAIESLMHLGCQHRLLFIRNTWLHGGRMGIPSGALNNLYTGLATVLSMPLNQAALTFWEENKEQFSQNIQTFWQGAEGYLLAERLATTLQSQLPDVLNKHMLAEQRQMLFGKPMHADGLYQQILNVIDRLIFLLAQD